MPSSLEATLASIPGLGGYLAKRKYNEDQLAQGLQQVQGVTGLQSMLYKQQQEAGLRGDLAAIGPNPSQEQLATVSAKYASPADILKSQTASLDRKAQLEATTAMRQASVQQAASTAQMRHEFNMAQAKSTEERNTESARHNKEMEGIHRQLANFNAPVSESEGGSVDKVAGMIAEGRVPPLSGFAMRSPWGQQVMAKVIEKNPDYRGQDYSVVQAADKGFTSGKQGNTIRSFNVALAHLDTLDRLSDALGNNDIQQVNRVAQEVSQQTGNPAPVQFDAAKKIVGDEIVKAIVGAGGGVSDREEAGRAVSRANSPQQLKGVISTYKELMRGQLGGLKKQYEASTKRTDFDERFLSDAAKKTATSQTPTGISEGQTATGPNGQKIIMKGGRWQPVTQ